MITKIASVSAGDLLDVSTIGARAYNPLVFITSTSMFSPSQQIFIDSMTITSTITATTGRIEELFFSTGVSVRQIRWADGTVQTSSPPSINTANFIDTSASTQTKSGGVSLGGSIASSSSYLINGQIAFSSRPVMHVSGFNSTLGVGVTFFAFISDSAITMRRLTITIVVAGSGGGGDTFVVTDGITPISVTGAADAPAGSTFTNTGMINIPAGISLNARQTTGGASTPTVNLILEYVMQ